MTLNVIQPKTIALNKDPESETEMYAGNSVRISNVSHLMPKTQRQAPLIFEPLSLSPTPMTMTMTPSNIYFVIFALYFGNKIHAYLK